MNTSGRNKRICKNQKGQSTLEFVMILPFLIIIILAASQIGFTVYQKNIIQQASREAARIISTTNDNNLAIATIKRLCGKDSEIIIEPASASNRGVGDMVTVYISQSPGGILKTMEKILGNGVTVRAGTSMRMECY
jgi:uncharacterized protein (UPF0333 family)